MSDVLTRLQSALPGNYRVERELGRGGMATVWLAQDLKHDRPVAIKVIHAELVQVLGDERFLREIRIAAHLQHPHILTLIDSGANPAAGATAGSLYYVMPYVEGETLRQRLSREGRLSPQSTVQILKDVLDALIHAHRHGIVHRDLKPENIMLASRHALVMDFGVAKALAESQDYANETLTAMGLALGTPAYMSPEQAAGQSNVDARSDLYAVGVLGYEMLSGKPPFTGPTPQAILASQVTQTPAALDQMRPELPPDLAGIIMRSLEKDPEHRWSSAEEMLSRLEQLSVIRGGRLRKRLLAGAVVLPLLIAAGWFAWAKPSRERHWVRAEAIPRMLALSEAGEYEKTYNLARQVESVAPDDSLYNVLRSRFVRPVSIRTVPADAQVFRKEYGAPDSTWIQLGRTPLDRAILSWAGGGAVGTTDRLRIQAPGYRTLELVGVPFDSVIPLDRDDAIPREMVRVGGGHLDYTFFRFGRTDLRVADFLMDRYEVTNREFKRFVDNGGYRRKELWEHPFELNGKTLDWAQAMSRMLDRTRRPGPATWEAGDYPAGQDDYPVGGVSWYEAAAYAKYAGKSLASVVHWNRAAGLQLSASVVPLSNYSSQAPWPVGKGGISPFGIYDMAGNVREWCYNRDGGSRFILGGGWNDLPYQFTDTYTQPMFDRSPINGIRLVKYLGSDSTQAQAMEPLRRESRDFMKERPASDAVFAAYKRIYEYDKGPLDARIVETVDEGDWTRQLIRMNAAYANDTLLTYVYLPRRGTKPFRVVLFWPGSNVVRDAEPRPRPAIISFILTSGRAVVQPVFKGTLQRKDALRSDDQDSTILYRDHAIMWVKDLSQSLNYLESRPEVTLKNLAYYGVSWGGHMGGLIPAVEPRIKVSVLLVAGLPYERARPEVDPFNFISRVRVPTLMLNGKYDFFFPPETSSRPMFRLLGTPADQKRYVLDEGSHFVPRIRLIQETLAWLDRYQPVR
ncbi:MAG: protein kinase domain-containing protein [Gemmatimonadales bacterium]